MLPPKPPGGLGLEVVSLEHDLWNDPELAPEVDILSSSSPLLANPLFRPSELGVGVAEVLRLAISSTKDPVVTGL